MIIDLGEGVFRCPDGHEYHSTHSSFDAGTGQFSREGPHQCPAIVDGKRRCEQDTTCVEIIREASLLP